MMKCCLCTDPETEDNLIFTCHNCSVSVHALCYGIEDPEQNWRCSPCQKNISEPVICELCHQSKGAFKPTSCGKWAHTICALFTEGVRFDDNTKMEPINISYISKTKRNKECSFCAQKKGFCGLCANSSCSNRIHVTCAQQNKCLQEVTNKSDNSLKFRAYCLVHKPKDSKRLSIGFVRKMVERKEKKEKDEKRAQSSSMNASWLMTNTIRDENALKSIKENADPHAKVLCIKAKPANRDHKQQKNSNSTFIIPKKPLSQPNSKPLASKGTIQILHVYLDCEYSNL